MGMGEIYDLFVHQIVKFCERIVGFFSKIFVRIMKLITVHFKFHTIQISEIYPTICIIVFFDANAGIFRIAPKGYRAL